MIEPSTTPITAPLVPALSTTRVAQRILGFLRHPRSLVRIHPSWQAPHISLPSVTTPALHTVVTAYRRRISRTAWARLSGKQPPANSVIPQRAPDLFVVTLHANVSGRSTAVDKEIRNSTATIHALFRLISGGAMHEITAVGEAQQDGSRSWTWQVLMTGEQLRQQEHGLAEAIHPRAA